MIHLPIKDRNNPPARLSVNGALRQIHRAIQNADGELYNTTYYKDSDVVTLLRAYSIHKTTLEPGDTAKCYYCESKVERGVTLQVEHYRPKAKVESGVNDNIELPGYYWLGLEWTNLLLSCPKCNGKGTKANKFPIDGVRAQPVSIVTEINDQLTLARIGCYAHEDPLSLELPILLNPEIDHPELFLTFDRLGNMEPHGTNQLRGRTSIDTYKLNREPLFIARQKIWNDLKKDILVGVGAYQIGRYNDEFLRVWFENICNKIIDRKLSSEEYTLWGIFINDHLEELLAETLDENFIQLFLEVYEQTLHPQQAELVIVTATD